MTDTEPHIQEAQKTLDRMRVEQNKSTHLGRHDKPLKAGNKEHPVGVRGGLFHAQKPRKPGDNGITPRTAEGRKTVNPEFYTQRECFKMKEEDRRSQERTKTDGIQCQQMYSNNKNNKAVSDKIWICTKK